MKKFEMYNGRTIMWLVIACVMVFTYFYSGMGTESEKAVPTPTPAITQTPVPNQEFHPATKETEAPSAEPTAETVTAANKPEPLPTVAVSEAPVVKKEEAPVITESAEQVSEQSTEIASAVSAETTSAPTENAEDMYCTFSVSCAEILDNMNLLPDEKHFLIPKDGIIMPEQKVVFYEGESVFEVLKREMKKNKIHLEFVNTPLYKSTYIEGINNLYEFDCGEHSGWIYSVNGEFPNYGSSSYKLSHGDDVKWMYTCTFGKAVGGYYAVENE